VRSGDPFSHACVCDAAAGSRTVTSICRFMNGCCKAYISSHIIQVIHEIFLYAAVLLIPTVSRPNSPPCRLPSLPRQPAKFTRLNASPHPQHNENRSHD